MQTENQGRSIALASVSDHSILYNEVVRLIGRLKNISRERLTDKPSFSDHGFDTLDLVDIILEVENKYSLVIPDEVPLHTVYDFVRFISVYHHRQAS